MFNLLCLSLTSAVRISEGGLLSKSTSKADVTQMVLAENSNFVGYLIEEGPQSLAEVGEEYRFNAEG